jgi:GGDEF domain-containing protein/uncharacterized protein (UPF0262 family)
MGALEDCERLKLALAEHFALAIRSAGEYAIDLHPERTRELREKLGAIESRAAFAASEEELQLAQASFRGELRDYRSFAESFLNKMRGEVNSAIEALRTLSDGVTSSGRELEARVKAEIAQLEAAVASDDVEAIRRSIGAVTVNLKHSYQQLLESNHALVAQLRDEVRALHQELDEERRTARMDPVSGAWIRKKLEDRMERLSGDRQSFWAILIWVGFKRAAAKCSEASLQAAMRALVSRTRSALGADTFVARWSEEVFVALVETEPADCASVGEALRKKLARSFAVQEDGIAVPVRMDIRTATVEHHQETPAAVFKEEFRESLARFEPEPVAP